MSDFFSNLLYSAAPLILASIGALFTEFAGVVGTFMEGFINMGAFFAWIIAVKTGSVLLGFVLCACMTSLCGWALARFVRKTGANPFVSGIALNIAAEGLINTLSTVWFGTKGVVRGIAPSGHFPSITVALLAVAAAFVFIKYTRWGLALRASGVSPLAARERGIQPGIYWEGAWAAAAFFAALAGASISQRVGAYTPGGVAGRGWMSLAAVYLGFRNPVGVLAAALVFALAERFSSILQGIEGIPASALLGIPSALAFVLYGFSHWLRWRRAV
ncbi:MAG: ABC transporter permease [Treponema sp.]|jgi:simple sugar transport system permease protein|nr:ABC transporter permease [Treponema sp.]